jgi:hypothetical protein
MVEENSRTCKKKIPNFANLLQIQVGNLGQNRIGLLTGNGEGGYWWNVSQTAQISSMPPRFGSLFWNAEGCSCSWWWWWRPQFSRQALSLLLLSLFYWPSTYIEVPRDINTNTYILLYLTYQYQVGGRGREDRALLCRLGAEGQK